MFSCCWAEQFTSVEQTSGVDGAAPVSRPRQPSVYLVSDRQEAVGSPAAAVGVPTLPPVPSVFALCILTLTCADVPKAVPSPWATDPFTAT